MNSNKSEENNQEGTPGDRRCLVTQELLDILDTPLNGVGIVGALLTGVFGILAAMQVTAAWEPGNYEWRRNAQLAMIYGGVAISMFFVVVPSHFFAALHFERKNGAKGSLCMKVAGSLLCVTCLIHASILLAHGVSGAKIQDSTVYWTVAFGAVAWAFMFGYAESARKAKADNEVNTDEESKEGCLVSWIPKEVLDILDTPLNGVGLFGALLALVFGILAAMQVTAAWEPGNYEWRTNATLAMIYGGIAISMFFVVVPSHFFAGRHFERKNGAKGSFCMKVTGSLLCVTGLILAVVLLAFGVNGTKILANTVYWTVAFEAVAWAFMFGYAESARKAKADNEIDSVDELKEDNEDSEAETEPDFDV